MTKNKQELHCGYVAIVGRPNAGKSTLLNSLLQKKITITSSKPQTTQKQILGIKTTDNYQIVFVDTPGLHSNLVKHQKNTLSKYMARSVQTAIDDVDLLLFLITGTKWTEEDDFILNKIKDLKIPIILAVNKIDRISHKEELLPFITSLLSKYSFTEVFYISALKNQGLIELENNITKYLPPVDSKEHFFFAKETVTDQNSRLQAAEIIREKIIRLLGEELPYDIAVQIEKFDYRETKDTGSIILDIYSIIWVKREGQKAIIIGHRGEKLKQIGESARLDLEKIFNCKIFLKLWVKVKSNWSDDLKTLNNLGFNEL